MAAVAAASTLSSRVSGRLGRARSREGGGSAGEGWKSDIVRQLKHRDQKQHVRFRDLVRLCTS